ncbi:pyrolysin [Ceratobasidium sp. AG-Ba]|nr:pyrolysin [Ceratobasidium sp. AG-Ba]
MRHLKHRDEPSKPPPAPNIQPASNPNHGYTISQRMPVEILSQIFAYASAVHDCGSPRGRLHSLITFRSVSRYWYHIITSSRSLWSHIDVEVYQCRNTDSYMHIHNRARMGLRYAQGSPIHIHFHENLGFGMFFAQEIIETFVLYVSSITALTFSFSYTEGPIRDILDLCANAAPGTLQDLTIREVYKHFYAIPNGPNLVWHVKSLRGLTSLQIGQHRRVPCLTLGDVADILVHSPNLRHLRFQGSCIEESEGLPTAALPLYSLRTLSLSNIDKSCLLHLLRVVATGRSRLSVRLKFDVCDAEMVEGIVSFLQRSRVISLALLTRCVNVIERLSTFPELHTLRLDLRHQKTQTLGLMLHPSRGAPICPNIKHLQCIEFDRAPSNEELELIQQMIKAYPLEEITIFGWPVPNTVPDATRRDSSTAVGTHLRGWMAQEDNTVKIHYPIFCDHEDYWGPSGEEQIP